MTMIPESRRCPARRIGRNERWIQVEAGANSYRASMTGNLVDSANLYPRRSNVDSRDDQFGR